MFDELKKKMVKALRWTEKYTKTDMVYLAKGGGWMMLDRAFSMAAALALSIAFANLLPKETYGTYKYVISVVGLLSLSTLSGMGTAVIRSSARGNDGSLGLAIRAEIKWGVLGALASLALSIYYYLNGNFVLFTVFGLVVFFVPFINVFSLYSSVLNGKKRFDLIARYDIVAVAVNFILILSLLFLTESIYLLILPYLLVNTALQWFFLWRTKSHVTLNKIADPEMVRYGKQLSAMGMITTLATMVDQLLVYYFLGPVQLAVYSMALAPTEQMKGVFKLIGQLAFPKFAEQTSEKLRGVLLGKTVKYALGITIMVAAYVVFAPYLYSVLFPRYQDSVFYSRLLSVSLISSASVLPTAALQAQKNSRALYFLNIYGSLLQLILLLIGVLLFGLVGLVLARVATRLLEFLFSLALALRREKYAFT